jgi:hypothetical protein
MVRSVLLLVLLACAGGLIVVLVTGWPGAGQTSRPVFGADDPPEKPAPPGGQGAAEEQGQERKRTPFAVDRAGGDAPGPIELDAKRALGYLKAICAIGPRMSGTAGMRRQQELIREHFAKLGVKVQSQEFTAKQVSRANPVDMTNLIAAWHPERRKRVILCSHYDTRPIADQEPDPRKWRETFLSANDGGSGVAFLMELGNHMKDLQTPVGVDCVFFDGEESIFDHDRDQYFFGSKHFAKTWKKSDPRPDYVAAVLLDMIAGKDPKFPAEAYSYQGAEPLVRQLWKLGWDLGCGAFQNKVGLKIQDDHLALLNVGIPAVDIIDFDYPHWHRLSDVPANCSEDGILQVGRVLTTWLRRLK